MSQKYQVLARRYRPQLFHDVVGQEAVVTTLKNAIRFDKIAHAYLFCGSRGIGKTTLARLFAKALNCQQLGADFEPCNQCPSCLEIARGQSLDVLEIDGASNRGIDDIRQINETALYAPSRGRFKIIIIDEVHMLTKEAFNALLKTLEEPPEKAKFFLATTEPHKVLPTIISRCQRFDLGRLQLSQIIGKLQEILTDLGRQADEEALHLIAHFSDGSLRDAESLLDQLLCFSEDILTATEVRGALGLVSQDLFFALDKAFAEEKIPFAFELVEQLSSAGKDLGHFLEQLIEHYRLLTLCKIKGETALHLPAELAIRYTRSAQLYNQPQCLYLLEYLLRIEPQFQKSPFPRISLESILLHLLRSKHRIPVEVLVRRLSELEKKGVEPQRHGEHRESTEVKEKNETTELTEKNVPVCVPVPENNFTTETTEKKNEQDTPLTGLQDGPLPILPAASAADPARSPRADPVLNKTTELPEKKPRLLEPVPFNPYKKQPERAAQQSELSDTGMAAAALLKHPSHYDTIMRFATVELEGTFKKQEGK